MPGTALKTEIPLPSVPKTVLNDPDYLHFIRVASVVVAIMMFMGYYLGRIGMGEVPNFLPLILSITAILLPETLQLLSRRHAALLQTAVLIFFFGLGWISILLDIDLSFLLYAAFLISVLDQLRNRKVMIGRRKVIKTVFIILFGLELVSLIWTQDYMNPLSPEAFAVGLRFIHVDTLFLSTLTSNIKNFHFPTLGLFGLEPLKYHSGSNFLFAAYAQLCNIGIFQFYNLAFPVIFIPQFFQGFFFAVVSNVRNAWSERRLFVSLVFFFFVLSGFVSQKIGSAYLLPSTVNSHFTSQSYCISLILAFLFIAVYSPLRKRDVLHENAVVNVLLILLIPLWFFIIGYTKLSTAVVIFAAFGYFLLRRSLLFEKWLFTATALSAVVLYFVLKITVESNENTFIIQPGSFYRMFVKGNVAMYFLLNYCWFLLLVITALIILRKSRQAFFPALLSGKFIIIETVLVASVVGIIPGLLIHIEGGSALYFSDIQYWLSATALVHTVPYFAYRYHNIRGKLLIYFKVFFFIILVVIVRESFFRSFYYFLKKNIRIRAALVYGKDNKQLQEAKLGDLAPLMDRLIFDLKNSDKFISQTQVLNMPLFDELRNLPDSIKTNALIYCENPAELEEFLRCTEATFYITAMSEMAMINGLYWKACYGTGAYGMQIYFPYPNGISKEDGFRLAKQKGFDYVVVINLKNHNYYIERL